MHIIPVLKQLESKYREELVVIGVHSAKFSSEKDAENIRQAIQRYDLDHAVINDKDFLVWKTYGVDSWPTLVLIDPTGHVVGGQAGEGTFGMFDKAIGQVVQRFSSQIDHKPLTLALEKEHRPKSLLSFPGKIAADAKGGRIFFSDSNHNRIVIATTAGAIQEVVGEGGAGLVDGPFSTARFFHPQGLSYDAARDSLYVADTENHAIRKVDLKAKTVMTLAGNGRQQQTYPPVGGVGKDVSLSTPWDVLLLGDKLYIAMAGTHQIWTLNLLSLAADPWAGDARENIQDGPRTSANLAQPSGLTTDGKHIFFADSEASAIREADPLTNTVSTIVGSGLFDFGDIDGKPPVVRLQHPLGVAFNPADGDIYVADTYNHKIKRIRPATRAAVTVIGTGRRGATDGPAKTAALDEPSGLAWVGDKLFIADTSNNLIRVYDSTTRQISTLKLTGVEKLASTE